MDSVATTSLPKAQPLVADGDKSKENQSAEGSGGFLDLLDFINPLQHIPVVSTIYRAATGDEISAAARIVGGGIFGGIPGLVTSAANAALDAATGKDAGELAISALEDITTPEATAPASMLDDGSALQNDSGEALVEVATEIAHKAPAAASTATAVAAAAASATVVEGSLASYRDPSLGLENEGKREQLSGELDKIALSMTSKG